MSKKYVSKRLLKMFNSKNKIACKLQAHQIECHIWSLSDQLDGISSAPSLLTISSSTTSPYLFLPLFGNHLYAQQVDSSTPVSCKM